MDFSEYQREARKTAIYPNIGDNYNYPLKGIGGETGEIFEKFKKLERDQGDEVTQEFRDDIEKEVGDVLWYLSNLCDEIGISLDKAATGNVAKLKDRQERGVLQGSGDNR